MEIKNNGRKTVKMKRKNNDDDDGCGGGDDDDDAEKYSGRSIITICIN